MPTKPASRAAVERWLATRDWKPFAFQREVWRAMADGRSGLLHANTGTGKTLAAWLGALLALKVETPPVRARAKPVGPPLSVLWITPMRALALTSCSACGPLDGGAEDGLGHHTVRRISAIRPAASARPHRQ